MMMSTVTLTQYYYSPVLNSPPSWHIYGWQTGLQKGPQIRRNLLAASCSHSGLDLSGSLNTQHSIRKNEIESSSAQKRKQINRRNLKLGVQKVQVYKHCSYYQLGAVKSVAGAKMETYRMEASTQEFVNGG
jgi:hypothetical protein